MHRERNLGLPLGPKRRRTRKLLHLRLQSSQGTVGTMRHRRLRTITLGHEAIRFEDNRRSLLHQQQYHRYSKERISFGVKNQQHTIIGLPYLDGRTRSIQGPREFVEKSQFERQRTDRDTHRDVEDIEESNGVGSIDEQDNQCSG